MPITNNKNKIIGIYTVCIISFILVLVMVLTSVLSGSNVVNDNGNLMQGYKIRTTASAPTTKTSQSYINFCTKLIKQQVENGGNTAISLTDTANTLSFLCSATNGSTKKQIENLLCQSAEETAAMVASIKNRTNYNNDTKCGILSSNTLWINSQKTINIKKSFLKTNSQKYAIDILRENFEDPQTSTAVRENVVNATQGNAYYNVAFNKNQYMNVVSGASFKALWENGASNEDTYNSIFTGSLGDNDATYFKTIESKYISGNTFEGITKDYKNGYTFVGIVPNTIEENTFYTLNDVIEEIISNKLLTDFLKSTTNAKVSVTLPYYVNSVNNPTCINFGSTLKKLKVTLPFSSAADYTPLAKDCENLLLDNYYISGDISITPAGAINNYSDVKISDKEFNECKVSVDFTHSFIYFIYDNKTNLPIYFGVVNDLL